MQRFGIVAAALIFAAAAAPAAPRVAAPISRVSRSALVPLLKPRPESDETMKSNAKKNFKYPAEPPLSTVRKRPTHRPQRETNFFF